jgi:hypothetical protein
MVWGRLAPCESGGQLSVTLPELADFLVSGARIRSCCFPERTFPWTPSRHLLTSQWCRFVEPTRNDSLYAGAVVLDDGAVGSW